MCVKSSVTAAEQEAVTATVVAVADGVSDECGDAGHECGEENEVQGGQAAGPSCVSMCGA